MAQKGNNQKKSIQKHQKNKKKTQTNQITETPIKINIICSNTPISDQLTPLPIPPKLEISNYHLYGSNYSYSSQYIQINTPFPQQTNKIVQNMDHPEINRQINFCHDYQEQENPSRSSQSSISEEQSSSQQLPQSQNPQPQPQSQENEGQSSLQPSQKQQNPLQKQTKARNKSYKIRTNPNKTSQANSNKKVFCKCKKTKCLKLYCDCFRLNQNCDGCNCVGCHNLQIYAQQRNYAIIALMERNPDPFGQKIEQDKHAKGCNCKKSNCLKRYCECYQAGLKCGQNCKCEDCKNIAHKKQEPSEDKGTILTKNTAKKQRRMVEIQKTQ